VVAKLEVPVAPPERAAAHAEQITGIAICLSSADVNHQA
jgi:hypothetical protein